MMGLASTSLVPSLWKWCGENKLCLAGVREGQDGQPEAEPAIVSSLEAVAEEQAAAEGAARQARVSLRASNPHISPIRIFCQTWASTSLGSSSINAKGVLFPFFSFLLC